MRYVILLSVVLSVMLSGCGFQLRGLNSQLSKQFQKTYLIEGEESNNNSQFYQSVKELIVVNGGNLSDKANANVTVVLSPITVNSRQIAIANNGLLKEYERTYQTTVTVLDSNNDVQLGRRVISTIKNIQLSDTQVLAGEEQTEITNKEAYRNLAQSVLLYLDSF